MDYAVEKCIDKDGNQRCSKPFLVAKDTCYTLEWSTNGALSHTTVEVRDAGSDEMVFYRDTNGEWTPEKGEVSLIQSGKKRRANGGCSWSTSISNPRCGGRGMTPLNTRSRNASEKEVSDVGTVAAIDVSL